MRVDSALTVKTYKTAWNWKYYGCSGGVNYFVRDLGFYGKNSGFQGVRCHFMIFFGDFQGFFLEKYTGF